ncbi:hypothetical protein L195_g034954, partial [Trifolium pratense]
MRPSLSSHGANGRGASINGDINALMGKEPVLTDLVIDRKIGRHVMVMATGDAPAETEAIDRLPLIPGVLELIGIGYTG